MYKIAKYQEKPEKQQAYQGCRDKKYAEIKTDHQKMRYQENIQMQKDFQTKCTKKTMTLKQNIKKRYQQNAEIDKKYQKQRYKENKKKL